MITIKITKKDADRLVSYVQQTIQNGHFGGGEIETPEEVLLIKKIRSCEGVLELSLTRFSVLMEFIYDAIVQGTAILIEDSMLIEKLLKGLQTYYQELRIEHQIDKVETLIAAIKDSLLLQERAQKEAERKSERSNKTDKQLAAERVEKMADLTKKMALLDKLAKGTS